MQLLLNVLVIGTGVVALWWWISRAYDLSERSIYWQQVRIQNLSYLLMAQFVTSSSLGFLVDLARGGNGSRLLVSITAVSFGAISAAYVWVARYPRWRVGARLSLVALFFVVIGASRPTGTLLSGAYSPSAIRFDAVAVFMTITLGSRLFRAHSRHEGSRRMRLETELSLAQDLQRILAPPIICRSDHLEIRGRSVPSDRVGGDLVDVVVSEGRTLVYLVDVSGHGIRAGALMGSVKTAIHMTASKSMPEMLEAINRVLPSVKEPQMYATFAGLLFEAASGTVRYTLAGHPPILHFRAHERSIELLSNQQFPVGLFPVASYASHAVASGSGDLFVLFSDGLIDVANSRDEEFGLQRLKDIVLTHASHPLEAIEDVILAHTASHGAIRDDRSLLLARVLR